MRFTEQKIEAAEGNWEKLRRVDETLDALAAQRDEVIHHVPDYARSKLAWKVAVIRQCFTYRIVDLAEAAIAEWERDSPLASIVLGRSLVETVAVVQWFAFKLTKALAAGGLPEIDKLVTQQTFGGKHEDWLIGEHKAVNVMTALDTWDREVPGSRTFYEQLSEMVHPNFLGTHGFYASLDTTNGVTTFSHNKLGRRHVIYRLSAALTSLLWAHLKLGEIDKLGEQVADLQDPPRHRGA